MPRLDPRPLLPPGLVVDAVEVDAGTVAIAAHPAEGSGRCPACGGRSDRVHSLHRRRLLDLPSHGHAVELLVRVRRFRCMAGACPRRTFTEPLPPGTTGRSGRRTIRIDGLVRDLGVTLGGRPGSALARRLMLPVGKDTLLRAIRSHPSPDAPAPCAIDPGLLSAAERLQYDGYLRRREENGAIRAMAGAGTGIKEIVRRTGRSRKLVRAVLRNAEDEVFRSRAGSLAPWLAALEAAWAGGCRNGAELWRRLRGRGFGGSLRVVGEWATRRRRSERADGAMVGRLPPARSIARAMLVRRERLTRSEAVMVTAIETALPALSAARELVDRFHRMIRGRTPDALPAWIAEAQASMLASFGRGIAADQPAVRAALSEPWSNGPTEGFITRLKLLRRQMYGRGKLDLLRARLLAPE